MKKYSAIGIDVSDKSMKAVGLNEAGEMVWRKEVACTREAVRKVFGALAPCVICLETGGHTGWLARSLVDAGHSVVVANARKVRAIYADERKSDWRDAEMLARLVRTDPKLLRPVRLRKEQTQQDIEVLKARDALLRSRTLLICTARSLVKNSGERVPACSAEAFVRRCRASAPIEVLRILQGLLEAIEAINEQLTWYAGCVEEIARMRYAEATGRLRQIPGVGPITSLAFVLAVEDPDRFRPRRHVGAYLGLTPRRDQSGETDKQLGITHAGNEMVRRLLVSASQYILGPFGPDSDLKRMGLRLAARGGKSAKKRAVVAVARKLAVLLLRLWQTGEEYKPLYNEQLLKNVA